MKCPKCEYLGFETGSRCKNCGYDFSLIQALPLFAPGEPGDDAPLVKLPRVPRPPLAVRRTPETPRLRTTPRPRPARRQAEPVLRFSDGLPLEPAAAARGLDAHRGTGSVRASNTAVGARAVRHVPGVVGGTADPTRAGVRGTAGHARRVWAAMIDHGILLGVDLAVVYFTLRMASLPLADWSSVPVVPMAAFLGLLKLTYFSAFTMVGGQTIGKMAARLRVVRDGDGAVEPARAVSRALAGALSIVTLGLGFLPAIVGGDGRAFHDRVARTRVVDVPSA